MEIVMMNIDEIIPYENNPRKNDDAVEAVANSIKNFGFKSPIVVDANKVIVNGHTRLKASKLLGLTMVPVIIASDLTEEQCRALRLADNKTAEIASWDKKLLMQELESIDWEGLEMDMTDFGFDNIFDSKPQEVTHDDFEEGQYIPATPYSMQGDVYLLGRHRIMCGDSTNPEMVKTLLNGNKADMIFTDPPYNVNYEGSDGQSIQNDNMGNEEFYNFLLSVYKNMFDSIKEGGSIYVCHADSEGLNFRKAFIDAGFKLAQCLIWVKNSFTMGRQDYQWQHEPILYGWKPGAGHYFVDDRSLSTVWFYDKPKHNDLHPTMKPLELVGQGINNGSLLGQLVLDLFGGSGSTLIACEQAGRINYSMELDEKYADVIVKRFIKYKDSTDDCYLIRDGVQIPLSEISDFSSILNSIN
ncbi:MAG: ParB N-terminal domain-containing protein [Clostridia bacterium]|nr:ParB N-terminal domain-containing protein [Clostridia bacterium]